jgi:hypothetical protein
VVLTNNNTNTVTFSALTILSPTAANGMSLSNLSTTTVTNALTFTANAATFAETITINGNAILNAGSVVTSASTSTGLVTVTCASGATGGLAVTNNLALVGSGVASSTGSNVDFGTVATACTVSAGSISITGGAVSAGLLKMGTGALTLTGALTFAGTAANAQLTTGVNTFSLTGGTIGSGGTLSINAGASLSSTGTSAINGAYTFGNITIPSGALTIGANITVAGALTISGGTLTPGASTITLSGTGTVFNRTSGILTASTSTFKITDASPSTKTFAGGGLATFNNIWITGAGTGAYTISGSNTFNDFKDDVTSVTASNVLNFTAGTTTTVTTFTVGGVDATHKVTLQSTSAGVAWNLSDLSGTDLVSFVSLQDSAAAGGALFDASNGTNTNVSGNTGWVWSSAPSITFTNTDSSIGFGALSSISVTYANGAGTGSITDTVAHTFTITTNAVSGYTLTYLGPTLTSGSKTILVGTNLGTGGTAGQSQFAMSGTLTGTNTGAMQTSYNHATPKWTYVAGATTVLASSTGPVTSDTINMQYEANILPTTSTGDYTTTITYLLTGNF